MPGLPSHLEDLARFGRPIGSRKPAFELGGHDDGSPNPLDPMRDVSFAPRRVAHSGVSLQRLSDR